MPERKASDILLSLGFAYLHVWKVKDDVVCVNYDGADVKEGSVLIHTFGRGGTFEGACYDYLDKIRGKTLVFDACSDKRREVTVLG
jgi:hypothetical protein